MSSSQSRTRKSQRSRDIESSQNETQSQPARSGILRLSEAPTTGGDAYEKTNNLVKCILNFSISKHPFKKPDLVKHTMGGVNKAFPQIWEQALAYLKAVYGLKVVEVAESKSTKQYFVVSILPPATHLEHTPEQRKRISLLYLILGIIYMKNGTLTENALWEFLKHLKITEFDEETGKKNIHCYFGDVSQYLTEIFPKQLYLKRAKSAIDQTNMEKWSYSWGERANQEVDKKVILESICKLLQKPSICFVQQHETAYPEGNNQNDVSQDEQMEVDQNEEEEEPVPSTSRGRGRGKR